MSEYKYFKYESVQDMDTITKYLDAIAEGFRKGELTLTREGETLLLKPSGLLGFTVEAKLKSGRRKLKFTLGWKEHEKQPEEERRPLLITAGSDKSGTDKGK